MLFDETKELVFAYLSSVKAKGLLNDIAHCVEIVYWKHSNSETTLWRCWVCDASTHFEGENPSQMLARVREHYERLELNKEEIDCIAWI